MNIGAGGEGSAMAEDRSKGTSARHPRVHGTATIPPHPSLQSIVDLVRFEPERGIIRMDDERMVLEHSQAFAERRREIVEALGMRGARALYTRIGYLKGTTDGERWLIKRHLPAAEALAAGMRSCAVYGYVVTAANTLTMNPSTRRFDGDFQWHGSIEAESHRALFGTGAWPACWEVTGYACGFCTLIAGAPILCCEYECVAMGHPTCRIQARPLVEWDDPSDDLAFLNIGPFVNRFAKRAAIAVPASAQTEAGAEVGAAARAPNRELVGASAGFVRVVRLLERVAGTDTTVLFQGESGVGKEMFARALHEISPRAGRPLVTVNCAAIPADLVEAELFGVEKGAYTGAVASRLGRFERAHGGTLFLDEIGSLPLIAQGKLLRALQEGEIERVGDTQTRHVDVRVVAAANEDLYASVEAGRFREDLFFRLNVFPIEIPPLRDRLADIPLLISHFLARLEQRLRKRIAGLSDQALGALWAHDWPGNIRELENVIERAAILVADGEPIDLQHLFAVHRTARSGARRHAGGTDGTRPGTADADPVGALERAALRQGTRLQELEDRLVDEALERTGGNVAQAARLLGISRSQMNYRVAKRRRQAAQHRA